MELKSNIPSGPIEQKWDKHKADIKLVNPANKRKFKVIVIAPERGGKEEGVRAARALFGGGLGEGQQVPNLRALAVMCCLVGIVQNALDLGQDNFDD